MASCDIKRGEKERTWGTCILLWHPYEPDKLLLCKRSEGDRQEPGSWGFVGGKVDVGETASEAIKREVLEEVGLKLVSYEFRGEFYLDGYLDFVFDSDQWEGLIKLDPAECEDFAWVTLNDIYNERVNGEPAKIFSFTRAALDYLMSLSTP